MTRSLLKRFGSHDRGGAAIEFGLVLPILIALLLMGVDGWLRMAHVQDAASALHAGARYYQQGGADDGEAVQVALAAWAHPSDDAEIEIKRESDSSQTFVTIEATSTYTGLKGSEKLSQKEVVRVQ